MVVLLCDIEDTLKRELRSGLEARVTLTGIRPWTLSGERGNGRGCRCWGRWGR